MQACGRVILMLGSILFALEVQAQSPDVEWTKTLQGNGAWSVQQTADNGYILTGEIHHGATHGDLHLIRTGSTGDTLWTRSIGSSSPGVYAGGRSVRECFDGSFIAVGNHGFGAYVVKTSSDGAPLWTRIYDWLFTDQFSCVRETIDHGYIISGFAEVWGRGDDGLIIRLNMNGDQVWASSYGTGKYERANAIIQTPDAGYVAVGSQRPVSTTNYNDRFWILKTNAAGSQEWLKVYGGPYTDVATAVCQAGDGGYLVAGYTNSRGAGDWDFYLMKLNSSGDSLWAETYGAASSERCYSMTQMGDNSFVLGGTLSGSSFNAKVLAVNVNADGDTLWTKQVPADPLVVAEGYAVGATEDGGCIIAGSTGTLNANTYLVKLAPDVTGVDDRSGLPARCELYQNVPNPFNPTTVIRYDVPPGGARLTLRVFDVSGKIVRTLADGVESAGQKSVLWDGMNAKREQVSTGIYFYRLTAGDKVLTKKMLLLK